MFTIRRLDTVLAAALVFAPIVPAEAQKMFSGTIVYRMEFKGKQGELTYVVKGPKVRQETRLAGVPQGAYQIIDYSTGDVITVMPAQRKYVKANYKQLAAALKGMGTAGAGANDKTASAAQGIAPTGRKETIAGYSCEVYADKSGSESCIATGLGRFVAMEGGAGANAGGGTGAPQSPALAQRFREGALPLRMKLVQRDGAMMITGTKIAPGSPPASAFVVPAGYEELRMPAGLAQP